MKIDQKVTDISVLIANICDRLECDNIEDSESLKRKVEDELTIRQIEKKYGDQIKQMPNGLWWIRLRNGVIIKLTRRENVIRKLIELENAHNNTINSIWNDFYRHKRLSTADGTSGKYLYYYETFIRGQKISDIPLKNITFKDCEEWAQGVLEIKKTMKNPNLTDKYFANVRGTLSQIFSYAVKCGMMSNNPALDVRVHVNNLTPRKIHNDEDDIFSTEEEIKVKKAAYQDAEKVKNALPLAIPLLFQTGLRDGELCALKWRDISGNILHVQSEIIEMRNDEGKFIGYRWVDHCKTKAGNRRIKLNSESTEILKTVKKLNMVKGLPIGQNDYIFLRRRKGAVLPCNTRCFESRVKRYCAQSGMTVLKSQHDIRRTFATNLHYLGLPTKSISALMGHDSIAMTEHYIKADIYSDNAVEMALERLSEKSEQIGTEKAI